MTPSPLPPDAGDGVPADKGERIAKRLARAGLCSRRDAERWIAEGRVVVDGQRIDTPATLVTAASDIRVDGNPVAAPQRARLWLYHKPVGLVVTAHDPEGRPTVFDALPRDMPRVVSVGRLDLNSEGLLLLTNDGALARRLELPSSGWTRRYRVRAHGQVEQAALDRLRDGVVIDGIAYGGIEAHIDRQQRSNLWLNVALKEGRNREVRRVMAHLGLGVNRLIRVAFGPFTLNDLPAGAVIEASPRLVSQVSGDADVDASGRKPGWARPKPRDDRRRPGRQKARHNSGGSAGTRAERGGKRPGGRP
ncbi:pseudouridine synthase [Vineibacter terrae]|uniref:pseudouridine synthase n=1 Tax=Vineibacter terrae TaxID=2586908 RepID=UPI0039C94D2C